jgi:hypothetical protein
MEQERFEELAQNLMDAAIDNYKASKVLASVAMIHKENDTDITFTMGQFAEILGPEMGKLAFSTMIRQHCQSPNTNLVAVIMETWMAQFDLNDYPEYEDPVALQDDFYEKYGSMQNWPEDTRTSAIIVGLEHRDGRVLTVITPFNEKTGEIGERMEPSTEMTGRMTNWFAPFPLQQDEEEE